MKLKFFAFCFFLMTCYPAMSQILFPFKKMGEAKTFTLKLKTEKQTTNGFLSGINDSLVQLSTKRVIFSNSILADPNSKTYTYAEVEKVNIRQYGSVSRGMVYGALIGGGIGGIIGLATYRREPGSVFDFGAGFNAMVGLFIGSLPGIVFGGIIGSKMKKFIINRKKENLEKMRATILDMGLSKRKRAARDSTNNNMLPSIN